MSDLRQCPYNKSHLTVNHRFHSHLVKCRRANPQIDLKICPFNATHHVPDLQLHFEDCADRIETDVYRYLSETAYQRYANSDSIGRQN